MTARAAAPDQLQPSRQPVDDPTGCFKRVGHDGQGDGYGRGLVDGQGGDGADDLAGCARSSDLALVRPLDVSVNLTQAGPGQHLVG